MAKKKQPRLVEVEWIDSAFTPGWSHDFATLSICRTVGYLTYSGKDRVVVAMNVSDSGSAGESMAIPRVCVKRIHRVGRL